MELWQQVEWKYRPEKPGIRAFARLFRVKMAKLKTLEDIGPALRHSKHWVSFEPGSSVYLAVGELVNHLIETYGLEIVIHDGALHTRDGEWTWKLPEDPSMAGKAMAALRQAAPSLEPRPYVRNGETDVLGWAVFSSTDWAELAAADLYAARALFPVKGKVPKKPKMETGEVSRRDRVPAHAELLAWVTENKSEKKAQLVKALDKLETSAPNSTEERDASSQIYRIGRRARR